LQNESGPAGIGNYEVAATAEDKKGKTVSGGIGNGLADVIWGTGFYEGPSATANTERGERRKRNLFTKGEHKPS
jgi:hypothetical protein